MRKKQFTAFALATVLGANATLTPATSVAYAQTNNESAEESSAQNQAGSDQSTAGSNEQTDNAADSSSSSANNADATQQNAESSSDSQDSNTGSSPTQSGNDLRNSVFDANVDSRVTARANAHATFAGTDMSGTDDSITLEAYASTGSVQALEVNAAFDTNAKTRTVTIEMANGLGIASAPGMVSNSDRTNWTFDASKLPDQLKGIITGATYTPNPDVYWATPQAGTLTYTIAQGTTNVNLTVNTSTDVHFVLVDNQKTIKDAVTVTTVQDGAEKEKSVLENYVLTGTVRPYLFQDTGDVHTAVVKPGGEATLKNTFVITPPNAGSTYKSVLTEEIVYTFRMDKNAGFTGFTFENFDGNNPDQDFRTEIDTTSNATYDIITLTLKHPNINRAKVVSHFKAPANAQEGSYQMQLASSKVKLIGEADYTTTANFAGVISALAVMPKITVSNEQAKLTVDTVSGAEYAYNKNLPADAITPLGAFSVYNESPEDASNQKMKLSFADQNIGVRMVQIATGLNQEAKNITITTRKGKTFTIASKASTANSTLQLGVVRLSLSELGSDADDYIAEVTYEMGDIAKGAGITPGTADGRKPFNGAADFIDATYAPAVVYFGHLLNPTVSSFSANITAVSADKDFSDSDAQTATNTMKVTTVTDSVFAITSSIQNSDDVVPAGSTKKNVTFQVDYSRYIYDTHTQTSSIKGVNAYLREGDYLTIDKNTITATWEGKTYSVADGTIQVAESVDNTGKKVYKLEFPDVVLGYYKDDGNKWTTLDIQYDFDVKSNAPTTAVQLNELFQIEPIDDITVKQPLNLNYYETTNKFNVDGSGDTNKKLASVSKDIWLKLQSQNVITVKTAANLNNGPWTTYNYAENKEILDVYPSGDLKYKIYVTNDSGDDVEEYVALVPIPKAGESVAGLAPTAFDETQHVQKDAFGWSASLTAEPDFSGSGLTYTALYSTNYETDKDSANWKTWDEIADKSEIRMVKLATTDHIKSGVTDPVVLPLEVDDDDLAGHAENTNIYASYIYRSIGGTKGYMVSQPVGMRLKSAMVTGVVFDDLDYDGIQGANEPGHNGVTVIAYDQATGAEVKRVVTKTINGVDGSYEFGEMDKGKVLNIVFVNPKNPDSAVAKDGSMRFTVVAQGGSTPTTTDHVTATTESVKASEGNWNTVHAGLIVPKKVTFTDPEGKGSTDMPEPMYVYPGDPITKPTDPTVPGFSPDWWYEDAGLTDKWDFDNEKMPEGDVTLHIKWNVHHYDIYFEGNGADNEGDATVMEPMYGLAYDQEDTLKANAFVRKGYKFKHWEVVEVSGNKGTAKVGDTFTDAEVVSKLTDDDNGKVVLKAIWDEAPTIKADNQTINQGDTFDPMDYVTATDPEDGDITNKVQIKENTVDPTKPGKYTVTYEVEDNNGNKTEHTIEVVVKGTPVIEADDITITAGEPFDPMDYVIATDNEDGDLTGRVTILSSNVDPNTPGVYHITYQVIDNDGNVVEKTIKVTVVAPDAEPEDKPEPDATKPASPALPQTGDSSMLGMLSTALAGVATSLAGIRRKRKK